MRDEDERVKVEWVQPEWKKYYMGFFADSRRFSGRETWKWALWNQLGCRIGVTIVGNKKCNKPQWRGCAILNRVACVASALENNLVLVLHFVLVNGAVWCQDGQQQVLEGRCGALAYRFALTRRSYSHRWRRWCGGSCCRWRSCRRSVSVQISVLERRNQLQLEERTMAEGSMSVAELALSCHSLRNKDWLSKSDPFVVVFVQPRVADDTEAISLLMNFQRSHLPPPSEHAPERITCAQGGADTIWHFIGETEVVWNELSPYFVSKFRVPWILAPRLRIRFEVYDMDNYEAPLAKQDYLGAYQADCGDLALARNTIHALSDKKGRTKEKMGSIRIIVDRYNFVPVLLAAKLTLRVQIAAGAGIEPGTQVFFVLLRSAPLTAPAHKASGGNAGPKAVIQDEEGAGWVRLHRSGAQASPATKREWTYQDVQLREDILTAGDDDRFLRLELYLHKPNGRHQRVGGTRAFTLEMMRNCQLNARQRLVPDVASGASLRSAEYVVDSAHCANGVPDRQTSASILNVISQQRSAEVFRPFMSSNRSNIKLTESEFVFRFSNFVWWPAAKKDGLPGVFRTLSGRKAPN